MHPNSEKKKKEREREKHYWNLILSTVSIQITHSIEKKKEKKKRETLTKYEEHCIERYFKCFPICDIKFDFFPLLISLLKKKRKKKEREREREDGEIHNYKLWKKFFLNCRWNFF